MQNRRPSRIRVFLAVQILVVSAFLVSYVGLSREASSKLRQSVTGAVTYPHVKINRDTPLWITPFYNDAEVVSDDELAAVLSQVRPRFSPTELKPNFVEHALRSLGS